MWRMHAVPDVQLTLVSPFSRATYSGMLPGTLAGLYTPDEMEIDLHRLCASCGARLIVEEVVGFDPQTRRIRFAERPPARFDVASIGIGSVPGGAWNDQPDILSIKPMATFLHRLETRLQTLTSSSSGHRAARQLAAVGTSGSIHAADPEDDLPAGLDQNADNQQQPRICILGAGAGGIEVTFCLDVLLQRRGMNTRLTLVDSNDDILRGYAKKTVRLARDELERRGIPLSLGKKATDYVDGRLLFSGGDSLQADLVIWATGAVPPPVLGQFELPKSPDGFLAVRPTLQTTADFPVFVVGDTATLVDSPIPKAGVYAVREGPVLWENIRRTFENRELSRYHPQRGFLSLLSTGDGRAIIQYKGVAAHGPWVWKLKDYIDKKFMRKFQDYRPLSPEMMQQRASSKESANGPIQMRCRGCGGKVGANVLAAALERIDVPASDFVVQGLNPPDDAAVINPQAGTADVLSVDFFQAFMDDPYIVGRVAALNSLSDLWATGAQPRGAMAMVTLPEGPHRQQAELLYQLLAGGLRELAAANATLLGGHTTESEDLTIGYTVIGGLDGRQPFSKADLKPGDRLILTKPLGTGVLLAGHMQCACRAQWMDAMLETMLQPNAGAARIARELNMTAVTDVTGFGLAGHLLEMLDASGVSATLSLDDLPLLDGFSELSTQGIRSSLDPANRETEDRIEFATDALRNHAGCGALFDPQTSGGLLIGIREDAAQGFLAAVREAGCTQARIIGTVQQTSQSPVLHVTASA
jgi:selenide,water dikinase